MVVVQNYKHTIYNCKEKKQMRPNFSNNNIYCKKNLHKNTVVHVMHKENPLF